MSTYEKRTYRRLTAETVSQYLAATPALAARLGGAPDQWTGRDVADGNLNSVFLVDGPEGSVCVKQALPYVRVAGESWPLDINHAFFEASYSARVAPFVGRLAPELFHFDPEQFVLAMEKLEPHIILRNGLSAGVPYPQAATDVAEYAARAAFHTSDLATPFERKFEDVALFAKNLALQRISVDLVFTDPYIEVWRNKVIPPLGAWAEALRADVNVKSAVARWRPLYLTKAQSLIHGDLHSGSAMVTPDDTRVIDGEFAWFGPSGFDVGDFIAHYVMAWFAKGGHAGEPAAYRARIAADIAAFWSGYERRFLAIWDASDGAGDGFPPSHFADPAGRARLNSLQRAYVAEIFRDALGFAAIKIIRRIIGNAQIADFLVIEGIERRAEAQAAALALARSLLIAPERFRDIADVIAALPRFATTGLDPLATRNG